MRQLVPKRSQKGLNRKLGNTIKYTNAKTYMRKSEFQCLTSFVFT